MKKLRITKSILIVVITFGVSESSYAVNVAGSTPATPAFVTDESALQSMSQEYAQLQKQYDELRSMYDSLQTLNNNVQNVHNDLNGAFDINGESVGQIFNHVNSEVDSWKWTAQTWDEALQGLSGGNQTRYQQLQSQYQTYYPNVMTENTYAKGSTQEAAQTYNQSVNVNKAAITQASYQFEDLNNRLQEIQQLSTQIANATTDKEALDLNSKLLVQQAYIQVEMLRMQTLVNQQIGQIQAQRLESQADASKMNADYLPTN